mmetsp:Transcript_7570/g.31478  ORF Transcript_7570/g.31478 Transcript_7570/m.31478 type:complete len:440 (+) Transcript_7570:2149-3468(+)
MMFFVALPMTTSDEHSPDYRGDYSRPGAVNAPTTATSASAHRDRIANHAVSSRSVGAASRLVTSKRTLHPKSTLHASAFGCLAVHRTVGQCMLVSPQTVNHTPITRPMSVHRDQNDSRLCLVWSVGVDDDDDNVSSRERLFGWSSPAKRSDISVPPPRRPFVSSVCLGSVSVPSRSSPRSRGFRKGTPPGSFPTSSQKSRLNFSRASANERPSAFEASDDPASPPFDANREAPRRCRREANGEPGRARARASRPRRRVAEPGDETDAADAHLIPLGASWSERALFRHVRSLSWRDVTFPSHDDSVRHFALAHARGGDAPSRRCARGDVRSVPRGGHPRLEGLDAVLRPGHRQRLSVRSLRSVHLRARPGRRGAVPEVPRARASRVERDRARPRAVARGGRAVHVLRRRERRRRRRLQRLRARGHARYVPSVHADQRSGG